MDAAEGLTDQLVIDLSSNGGGYIALADLVLRTLDPDFNVPWAKDSNGEAVSPMPPLTDAVDKNSVLLRSYLRPSVQEHSPMKGYYPSRLNYTSVRSTEPCPILRSTTTTWMA
jgi:hypothetical protein